MVIVPLTESIGSGKGVEPFKKLLHLTDPALTLREVGANITTQYKKLYPTESALRVDRLQDGDQLDLDPDYTVEDVFKLGDQCRALVTIDRLTSNQNETDAIPLEVTKDAPVLASQNTQNYFQSKNSQIPQKSPRPRSSLEASPDIAPQRLPKLSPPQDSVSRDVPIKQAMTVKPHRVTLGMLNVPNQTKIDAAVLEDSADVHEIRRVIPDEDLNSVTHNDDEDIASVSMEQLTRDSDLLKTTETMEKDEGVNLFKKHILKFSQQSKKVESPIPKSLNIDMVDSPHKGEVRGTRLSRRTILHSNEDQVSTSKGAVSSARTLPGGNATKRDVKSSATSSKTQPQAQVSESHLKAQPQPLKTLKAQPQPLKTLKAQLQPLKTLKAQLQLTKNQSHLSSSDLEISKKLLALSRQFNYFEQRLDKYKITRDTRAPVFPAKDLQALDLMDYHYDDGSGLLEATIRLCPREDGEKIKAQRGEAKGKASSTDKEKKSDNKPQHFFECPENSPGGGVDNSKGSFSGAELISGRSTTPTTSVQGATTSKATSKQVLDSQDTKRETESFDFNSRTVSKSATGSAKAAFLTTFSGVKTAGTASKDREKLSEIDTSLKMNLRDEQVSSGDTDSTTRHLTMHHSPNTEVRASKIMEEQSADKKSGKEVSLKESVASSSAMGARKFSKADLQPRSKLQNNGQPSNDAKSQRSKSGDFNQAHSDTSQAMRESLPGSHGLNSTRHNATAINLLSNFAQQKRRSVSLGQAPAPTKDYEELKRRGDEIHNSLLGELQEPKNKTTQNKLRPSTPASSRVNEHREKDFSGITLTHSSGAESSDSDSSDSSGSEDNVTSRKARLVAKHPKPISRTNSATSTPMSSRPLIFTKRTFADHDFSTPQPKQISSPANSHKEVATEPISKIRKIEGRLLSRLSSLKDLQKSSSQKANAASPDVRSEVLPKTNGSLRSKPMLKLKSNPFSGLDSLDDDSSDSESETQKLNPKFLTVLRAMNRKRSYGRLESK